MSWESFESWPGGGGGGGAFRSAAEPVVAERRGLRGRERLRLFFKSSPDLPAARVAERAALTATYVYVERRDGSQERVRREQLRGVRRDGPVGVFGVVDAEDLFLPWREGDDLQDTLVRQLGQRPAWVSRVGIVPTLLLAVVLGFFDFVLFAEYPVATMRRHWSMGLTTSESSLGTYAAFGLALLILFFVLWLPSHLRIDETGLTRWRGVIPWMRFETPPEVFRRVRLETIYGRTKSGGRFLMGYAVELDTASPRRIGSLVRYRRFRLQYLPAKVGHAVADALAARISQLLGVPR